MKLLIKFPTRGRKEKFLSTFKKYQDFIIEDNTEFSITIDEDDVTMNNSETLSYLRSFKNTKITVGTSTSKVDAINRDIDVNEEWDIILLASDDMIPQVKGFDKVINSLMKKTYPDTDGILFFNDGFKGNELNTLCILGKKYYQRFGYIYYPEYKSTWCDNEFMVVGDILRKQTYFPMTIIKHEHPDWGFDNHDEIHKINYQNVNYDMSLYNERKKINFNIE